MGASSWSPGGHLEAVNLYLKDHTPLTSPKVVNRILDSFNINCALDVSRLLNLLPALADVILTVTLTGSKFIYPHCTYET